MKFDREGFRSLVKDHRLRLGLLVFVTLVCGLLIGTVLPGRGAVSRAIGRDSATPLAIPNPVHLSSEFASTANCRWPSWAIRMEFELAIGSWPSGARLG